jgi:toxin ParE1/3/4
MSRLERTHRADVDLLKTWVYVAERDLPAADRLLARLESAAKLLAHQPLMGEVCSPPFTELRRFSVGNYIMVYRPLPDGIRVLRVIHGARDFQSALDEMPDDQF